ncbi:MAG: hypothetical protein A3K68_04305 [Euryarchaeota archaeon RBG_16_68_13]|nr:MAG: hypothetical protein A3K68_04305 [Euryarchaeota archaeon RBG_16_68_13]
MAQDLPNRMRGVTVAGILAALLGASLLAGLYMLPTSISALQAPRDPAATAASFTFAAVGDLDRAGDGDMLAIAKRLATANVDFLLALGDLGYVDDEDGWCASIKGAFNNVILIAGNHDTTESGPGDIAQFVQYCPFTLGVPLTGGPGTPGYGYEYYFDYPSGTPLVRFILTTAGVTGAINYNYGAGSSHYNWVVDSINGARAAGIPWVVVGMHKQCLTVGSKTGCNSGQALFDKMVDLKVDLILQAHDHVYERSKQLALGSACTTVPAAGNFDADCVVADGANGSYDKGVGSIEIVSGGGGRDLYTVRIDGSDREIGYFAQVMGNNANTQGRVNGHGAVKYTVTADAITGATDYCPLGTTDATGACAGQVDRVFRDTFTIRPAAPPTPNPTAVVTHSPAWVRVGEPVSFDASGSTPSEPSATLECRWDWTNDGTWDTAWSATMTASHAYAAGGTVTVRLEVRDSLGLTDNATAQVAVDGAAPSTTASLGGTSGSNGWHTSSSVGVTLSATDDASGVAQTRYRVDGGSWQTYASTFQLSGEGPHTVEFNSTDRAGNSEALKSAAIKIDSVAPATSHSLSGTLVNGTHYRAPVTVTLTASDATSGVAVIRYRVDGGSWFTYTSPVGVLSNGTHVFEYVSADVAGNVEATKQVVFAIGSPSTGPTSIMTESGALASTGWYLTEVTLTFTVIDPSGTGATVHVRVDGGAWQTYASPIVLGDGNHTVEYYATDSASHTEPTRSGVFKVDATPPSTVPTAAGTAGLAGWFRSSVTVTLTTTDAASGVVLVEARADGGAWQPYAGPIAFGEGRHTLEYRSKDLAGNEEAAPGLSYNVDTQAPSFSYAGPQGPLTVSQVEFTWAAEDATSGVAQYEISVDGGDFAPALAGSATLTFADGAHYVTIRATDRAGNARVTALDVRVDTNAFSLTGPYSGLPMYLLIEALLASALVALLWHRRRVRAVQKEL